MFYFTVLLLLLFCFLSFEFKSGSKRYSSVPACVCAWLSVCDRLERVCYSWQSRDKQSPASAGAHKAASHVIKALHWVNGSAGSDMHIRWQKEKPACVFVSQCAEFTLDSIQKRICLGHLSKPPQTFGEDFLPSRLFLSLLIFTSFHTSMRWGPMKGLSSRSAELEFLKRIH